MSAIFALAAPAARPLSTRLRGVHAHSSLVGAAIHLDVRGEVDAANADELVTLVDRAVVDCRELVLDLSGVDFLGLEGFTALMRVRSSCHRNGVRWIVVPSPEVARVMRLCDRDRSVPTATTVEAAL